MLYEDKAVQENVLQKEHIDEIYNLYVVLTDNDKYTINPYNFINIFHNLSEKENLAIDKDIWNQIFFQIDHDKDGTLSFQDFIRFIYLHLKLALGECSEKISYNKIKYYNIFKHS
jgi:Ca2+-binding EF-hand superfamily protein